MARELDRRGLRRRLTLWTVLLVVVAVAALYLRWGGGLGLGGAGDRGGSDGTTRPLAGPRRCAIRVSARGITVDGRAMSRDEAVAACAAATGADVVVTGDAREGDWNELADALAASGVKDIAVHEPTPARAAPADPAHPRR